MGIVLDACKPSLRARSPGMENGRNRARWDRFDRGCVALPTGMIRGKFARELGAKIAGFVLVPISPAGGTSPWRDRSTHPTRNEMRFTSSLPNAVCRRVRMSFRR